MAVRHAEIGLTEVCSAEIRLTEGRPQEICPLKGGVREHGAREIHVVEVCSLEIRRKVGMVSPPLVPRCHPLLQPYELLLVRQRLGLLREPPRQHLLDARA